MDLNHVELRESKVSGFVLEMAVRMPLKICRGLGGETHVDDGQCHHDDDHRKEHQRGIGRLSTRAEVDGCEVASAQMTIAPETAIER